MVRVRVRLINHALDARQVLGQVAPVAPGRTPGSALGKCLRVLLLLGLGDRLAANREFDGARIAERWWFA